MGIHPTVAAVARMSCRTSWKSCSESCYRWGELSWRHGHPPTNEPLDRFRSIMRPSGTFNEISDGKLTSSKAIAELLWKRTFRCAAPSDATSQKKQTRTAVDR